MNLHHSPDPREPSIIHSIIQLITSPFLYCFGLFSLKDMQEANHLLWVLALCLKQKIKLKIKNSYYLLLKKLASLGTVGVPVGAHGGDALTTLAHDKGVKRSQIFFLRQARSHELDRLKGAKQWCPATLLSLTTAGPAPVKKFAVKIQVIMCFFYFEVKHNAVFIALG